jgi:hypothetical protein
MMFQRGNNTKETLGIGLGSEANIARLISRAIKDHKDFKSFVYGRTISGSKTHRHIWSNSADGGYFTLYKSSSFYDEKSPEWSKGYFIEWDFGGFKFGNRPLIDFLKDIGVKL